MKSSLRTIVALLLIAAIAAPSLAAVRKTSKKHIKQRTAISRQAKQKAYARKAQLKKAKKARKSAAAKAKKAAAQKKAVAISSKRVTGSIFIFSKHQDLDIYFDEETYGAPPVRIESVKKGSHVVEAYRGPELVYRRYLKINNGKTVEVEIDGKKEVAEEDSGLIL